MDVHASAAVPCTPSQLFDLVADLAMYPQWMDLVHSAIPVEGEDHVWSTELRARIGPLTRGKRLRMQRTVHRPPTSSVPGLVRFERAETDGRDHSAWVLQATVSGQGSDSLLEMELHYGGSLWTGGLLERALEDHIRRGRERLITLATTTPQGGRSGAW